MTLSKTMWAAIRICKDENNRPWIDSYTVGCLKEDSVNKAKAADDHIPQWAAVNPVVSYQEVEISCNI